eukprot:997940-Pelagomonas_calceolata.AAC.4
MADKREQTRVWQVISHAPEGLDSARPGPISEVFVPPARLVRTLEIDFQGCWCQTAAFTLAHRPSHFFLVLVTDSFSCNISKALIQTSCVCPGFLSCSLLRNLKDQACPMVSLMVDSWMCCGMSGPLKGSGKDSDSKRKGRNDEIRTVLRMVPSRRDGETVGGLALLHFRVPPQIYSSSATRAAAAAAAGAAT